MADQVPFRERSEVHAVVGGLQQHYGLSDDVYARLVYGLDTIVDEDGELGHSIRDGVAVIRITPDVRPHIYPALDEDDEPLAIRQEADEIGELSVVSFYDPETDRPRIGEVVSVSDDGTEAKAVVGGEGGMQVKALEVGGLDVELEINGKRVGPDVEVEPYNPDDVQEQDWWRLDALEAGIESDEFDA